jgi:hypothetical protein
VGDQNFDVADFIGDEETLKLLGSGDQVDANSRGEAVSSVRGVVVSGGNGTDGVQKVECLYVVVKKFYSASKKLSLIW